MPEPSWHPSDQGATFQRKYHFSLAQAPELRDDIICHERLAVQIREGMADMEHSRRLCVRLLSFVLTGTVLSVLLAGCGGGAGNTVPIATHAQQAQGTTKTASMLRITAATIPSVMAKFIRGTAYYMPMRGQHIKRIGGLRPLTVSSGMDLSFYGGPVQTGASEYNILVNCADETCWGGMISQSQNDLLSSNMMSILSQYNAGGTYSAGGDYPVSYTISGTLGDQDVYNILYNVITANSLSTGYGAEYHVFLAQGVQECSQAAGGCYAQQYCAYHGSSDWSDIGHVLYSVEPYQGITGCEVSNQPSPNGVLQDSTASTLSHETFETITDPDVAANNIAWYNNTGGEIGDLCAPAAGVPTGNVLLGADTWEIQMEYDNNVHDCSYQL